MFRITPKVDYWKFTSIYNGLETMRIKGVKVVGVIKNPHSNTDYHKWCQFEYDRSELAEHIHCPINLSEIMIDADLVEVGSEGDLVYRIHRDVYGHMIAGVWYFEKNKDALLDPS